MNSTIARTEASSCRPEKLDFAAPQTARKPKQRDSPQSHRVPSAAKPQSDIRIVSRKARKDRKGKKNKYPKLASLACLARGESGSERFSTRNLRVPRKFWSIVVQRFSSKSPLSVLRTSVVLFGDTTRLRYATSRTPKRYARPAAVSATPCYLLPQGCGALHRSQQSLVRRPRPGIRFALQ
jgi:hypothetical protein